MTFLHATSVILEIFCIPHISQHLRHDELSLGFGHAIDAQRGGIINDDCTRSGPILRLAEPVQLDGNSLPRLNRAPVDLATPAYLT